MAVPRVDLAFAVSSMSLVRFILGDPGTVREGTPRSRLRGVSGEPHSGVPGEGTSFMANESAPV